MFEIVIGVEFSTEAGITYLVLVDSGLLGVVFNLHRDSERSVTSPPERPGVRNNSLPQPFFKTEIKLRLEKSIPETARAGESAD